MKSITKRQEKIQKTSIIDNEINQFYLNHISMWSI